MPAPTPTSSSRPTRERGVGLALIVVSATAFGALPILAKAAYADGADPVAVLCGRFVIATAVMLALARTRGARLPRGRLLGGLAVLGGIAYVGQSLTFFTAADLIPVSLASLLFYVYPALVVALAVVFLHDRVGPRRLVALVAALIGTSLTVGASLGGGDPVGIGLALLAALCYVGYIVVGSRLAPRAGALAGSTVVMGAAAVSFLALTLVTRPAFPASASGWAAVTGLALLSTVVAVTTFFAGVERIGPADASTLSTLEPLVTVVLAALLLDERLGPVQLAGGVLILAAAVVVARSGQPDRTTGPRPRVHA